MNRGYAIGLKLKHRRLAVAVECNSDARLFEQRLFDYPNCSTPEIASVIRAMARVVAQE